MSILQGDKYLDILMLMGAKGIGGVVGDDGVGHQVKNYLYIELTLLILCFLFLTLKTQGILSMYELL